MACFEIQDNKIIIDCDGKIERDYILKKLGVIDDPLRIYNKK